MAYGGTREECGVQSRRARGDLSVLGQYERRAQSPFVKAPFAAPDVCFSSLSVLVQPHTHTHTEAQLTGSAGGGCLAVHLGEGLDEYVGSTRYGNRQDAKIDRHG
eukprot:1876290-Rhodomonas_salina.1